MSILILAALTVAVGCGDGKRSHRSRVVRPQGKTGAPGVDGKTRQQPGTTGTGTTPTGGSTTPGPAGTNTPTTDSNGGNNGPLKTNDDLKRIEAKQKNISALWDAQIKDLPAIDITKLEAGTYTLESTFSHLSMRPAGKPDYIEAAQVFQLQNEKTSPLLVATNEGEHYGVMVDQPDPGRAIAIPSSFQVEQPYRPQRENEWLYFTQMVSPKVGEVGMQDSVGKLTTSANVTFHLTDLLAGQISKDSLGKDLKYSILKLNDGRIRIVLLIDEFLATNNKESQQSASMNRRIVLTYRFEPKPAEQRPTSPAPAAPDTTPAGSTPGGSSPTTTTTTTTTPPPAANEPAGSSSLPVRTSDYD